MFFRADSFGVLLARGVCRGEVSVGGVTAFFTGSGEGDGVGLSGDDAGASVITAGWSLVFFLLTPAKK
ncbi:MAG: hypothetical protein KF687_16470 [Cyclobacteriaceae bacterium]|nr:hypothetical protein [Cyclobacteriaceae bacterium]